MGMRLCASECLASLQGSLLRAVRLNVITYTILISGGGRSNHHSAGGLPFAVHSGAGLRFPRYFDFSPWLHIGLLLNRNSDPTSLRLCALRRDAAAGTPAHCVHLFGRYLCRRADPAALRSGNRGLRPTAVNGIALVVDLLRFGLRFLGDPSAATSQLAGCLSGGSGKVRRLGPSGGLVVDGNFNDTLLGYFHLGFSTLFEGFGTDRGVYRSFGSRVPKCGCPTHWPKGAQVRVSDASGRSLRVASKLANAASCACGSYGKGVTCGS